MTIIDKSAAETEVSPPQKVSCFLNPEKHDGKITMGISEWEPDSSGAPHSHSDWDEHFFILSGQGEMLIGDNVYPVKKDMAVQIPRNIKHTVTDSGNEGLKMVYILAHY